MNKEFLRRLGKVYPNSIKRDEFGKREATPKEIADRLNQSDNFVELEEQYMPNNNDVEEKE